jgi:phosphorylcholine metabolism protein LicD
MIWVYLVVSLIVVAAYVFFFLSPMNKRPPLQALNDKQVDRLHRGLFFFDRVCKANNIAYVIEGGTMLGAARHGGLIPWDDDADVFMLESEWRKLEAVQS